MSLIQLKEIHVSFGPQVVLEGVDLVVHPGDRMGIVGPNGAGKSSLLSVILGRVRPQIGQVVTARHLTLGHLPQEVAVRESVTLHDYLRSAFASTERLAQAIDDVGEQLADAEPDERPALMKRLARLQTELDAAGGYHYESRIGQVSAGLGLEAIEPDRPLSQMSGGQVTRAALARLLLTEPDLLLLDEPTNHLDLAAVEWLEGFLRDYAGTMIVVSHDRYLLGQVVNKVLHVQDRGLRLYAMGFAEYVQTRKVHRLQQQRDYDKQQEFIAKEREFINRFRSGQRAKEARGRETRLERRIKSGELTVERPDADREFAFDFHVDQPGGDMIVRCSELSKAYGPNVLFDRFEWEVTRGQKVALMGPNGVGKTTLIQMLMNRVQPDSGKARLFENLDVAYFDQHQAELAGDHSVLEHMKSAAALNAQQVRNMLAAFGFRGDAVDKPVSVLSGGEKNRLTLLAMVLGNHQVLVMDEPTNHLDISAREALEEALSAYPGTLIMASHDRYFLDRVADHLLILGPGGRHEYIEGGYSQWQRILAEREARKRQVEADAKRSAARARKAQPDAARPQAGADWPEELRPLAKLSLSRLEEKIMELEFALEELHNQFNDPAIYADPARLAEVGRRIPERQAELKRYNAAWELKVG
ncbi:MAG: putative ABC transporter ATP-binding protein YheS [Phycisphaerae bacterium]|nr:putative ABC transporter ATP-binding protein YheS [Phycisphaerae bacterium]